VFIAQPIRHALHQLDLVVQSLGHAAALAVANRAHDRFTPSDATCPLWVSGALESSDELVQCVATAPTVGVLEQAAIRGLVDLAEALTRLQRTNFRISAEIIDDLLIRDTEREREQEGERETEKT
jgi:hypothetical protein